PALSDTRMYRGLLHSSDEIIAQEDRVAEGLQRVGISGETGYGAEVCNRAASEHQVVVCQCSALAAAGYVVHDVGATVHGGDFGGEPLCAADHLPARYHYMERRNLAAGRLGQ